MIRQIVLYALVGFALSACVQNAIFGECSRYSKQTGKPCK